MPGCDIAAGLIKVNTDKGIDFSWLASWIRPLDICVGSSAHDDNRALSFRGLAFKTFEAAKVTAFSWSIWILTNGSDHYLRDRHQLR